MGGLSLRTCQVGRDVGGRCVVRCCAEVILKAFIDVLEVIDGGAQLVLQVIHAVGHLADNWQIRCSRLQGMIADSQMLATL